MKRIFYRVKPSMVYMPILLFGIGALFGNYTNLSYRDYFEIAFLGLLLIGIIVISHVQTYLEIRDDRTLFSRGYYSFGVESIDILNIKYIYRCSQFVFRGFGSRMIIYYRDNQRMIREVPQREINYSEETIRAFLTRLKQLNTAIELDPEYVEFLDGKRTLNTPSQNTIASIEQRLRDRGEKW